MSHQTQIYFFLLNKLFSEEKVLRTQFEARKVAGSATYKQSKTVRKSVVLNDHEIN